ncbi:MAG: hypothetical protein ACK559_07555, partial [bacterium]
MQQHRRLRAEGRHARNATGKKLEDRKPQQANSIQPRSTRLDPGEQVRRIWHARCGAPCHGLLRSGSQASREIISDARRATSSLATPSLRHCARASPRR